MKQPTLMTQQSPQQSPSNILQIAGILTICRMIRIDNSGRVLFRDVSRVGVEFEHKEVPYVDVTIRAPNASPDDPNSCSEVEQTERYYFCRRYLIQASVYLPYLIRTKHLDDKDVDKELPNLLTAEDLMLEMKLSADDVNKHEWPNEVRKALFERCIRKYYAAYSANEVARLLFTTEKTVRHYLNSLAKVLSESTSVSGTTQGLVRTRLKDTLEYKAIQKEVHAARVKARNSSPPIAYKFTASDVLVRVYDVHGNSGRLGGERVVPRVCPVLRIPLDYDVFEGNKALNKIRVWRKTPGPDGMAPLSADNVSVMSRAAAWAIEGAYGANLLAELSEDARQALAEWQEKYGTRKVPREFKVGRPKKIKHV